jgi:hypothetical protein
MQNLNPVSDEILQYDRGQGVVSVNLKKQRRLADLPHRLIISKIKSHLKEEESLHVHLSLRSSHEDYSAQLIDILHLLNRNWQQNKEITLSWFVLEDDEDVKILAIYFQEMFQFPMHILMI